MRAFLRQMFETHREMTASLVSLATRGTNRRYSRPGERSDAEVVMSDLAVTLSDLGTASARVIEGRLRERGALHRFRGDGCGGRIRDRTRDCAKTVEESAFCAIHQRKERAWHPEKH